MSSFFKPSLLEPSAIPTDLDRISSFMTRYFSISSKISLYSSSLIILSSRAFKTWLCMVLSLLLASTRMASCFAAFAEHLRPIATPATSNKLDNPAQTSSAIPGTNPTPVARKAAPPTPAPSPINALKAEAPLIIVTALLYFLKRALRNSTSDLRNASSSPIFCRRKFCGSISDWSKLSAALLDLSSEIVGTTRLGYNDIVIMIVLKVVLYLTQHPGLLQYFFF